MTIRSSRMRGLYRKKVEERRAIVADATGLSIQEIRATLKSGGLTTETADKFVENVLGTYALPFGVALNVRVNGTNYVVPMVVEEPSVIAAASHAAKMVRAGGGFTADVDPPIMTCQVQLFGVKDGEAGAASILREKEALLEMANRAVPKLVGRGGGAIDLDVRCLEGGMLVTHLYVDCRDAMGANLVNKIAETVGDRIAVLGGGKRGLRILSNLCDRRCVRVRVRVPERVLSTETLAGSFVIEGIENASRFAEADPYRAATHNKGIMNGIDAVCVATGNDWRAVEAGAHAFAARSGRYQPLAIWRGVPGPEGTQVLEGSLELPLALGSVGGTLRVHPAAQLALRLLGTTSAGELAIQRGHMALHARTVAIAAGASADEVDHVALLIVEARDITIDGAVRALRAVRDGETR
jgi:hydroxymethylglutaryl-CoA reductase